MSLTASIGGLIHIMKNGYSNNDNHCWAHNGSLTPYRFIESD